MIVTLLEQVVMAFRISNSGWTTSIEAMNMLSTCENIADSAGHGAEFRDAVLEFVIAEGWT